jgi:glycosyltransferase involved in cell wall biosynthesis
MHCPDLKDLPGAAFGKTGWPWTEESKKLRNVMPDGAPWPEISIVTPSLNQGKYIEETIRSVLLQGYPKLEYIIIDGGSTDASVEIIRKYEQWLTYWVSEPDKGQSHAINKGFERATGEILAYINSDDLYCPSAFRAVAPLFVENAELQLVAGRCVIFDGDLEKSIFTPWWPDNVDHFLRPFSSTFAQPASFWRRNIYTQVHGFDESLHFCFDQEFFLKVGLEGVKPHLLSDTIARYRHHANIKTNQTIRFYEESIPLINKYAYACGLSEKQKRALLRETEDEVSYIEVFVIWKNRGRFQAVRRFLSMIMRSPAVILKRKVLGLGRRLLSSKAEDVNELKNV